MLATKNPGKLKELKEIAHDCEWLELLLAPDNFIADETGQTYLENAIIKAREAARLTGKLSLADDSGLEVFALDGRPGVHSARYAQGSDATGRSKLLNELKDIKEDRKAQFVCVMVLWEPGLDKPLFHARGVWTGNIGFSEAGNLGFGYDPIFYPDETNLTAAQIPAAEKNLLSHRGKAWRNTLAYLKKNFITA